MPSVEQDVEIQSLKKIEPYLYPDSILFVGLEDILIKPHGSDGFAQWIFELVDFFDKQNIPESERNALINSCYHDFLQLVRAESVSIEVRNFVNRLQREMKIPVVVVTRRDYVFEPATTAQLEEAGIKILGIDLSQDTCKSFVINQVSEQSAVYKQGVLYCSGQEKANCVRDLLDFFLEEYNIQPGHMIMVDTNLTQIKRVGEVVRKLEIAFNGIKHSAMKKDISLSNRMEHYLGYLLSYIQSSPPRAMGLMQPKTDGLLLKKIIDQSMVKPIPNPLKMTFGQHMPRKQAKPLLYWERPSQSHRECSKVFDRIFSFWGASRPSSESLEVPVEEGKSQDATGVGQHFDFN